VNDGEDIGLEELAGRLGDSELIVVDVRTPMEYAGTAGAACDPRQGHIPGARNVELAALAGGTPDELRATVAAPDGAEIICYCHSGARSGLAAALLRTAGYRARNYPGSWHEWSRAEQLPFEQGA
jgi:thiosulfate/3-mercaptopyruvate sulfurtransferase